MTKRATLREEQAAAEAAKVWRQVRWTLAAILAALLVAGLFLTGILPPRKKLTPTDLAVLGKYDAIRHALANEQLDEAHRAAELLAAIAEAKPIFTEPAKSIANSDSLAAAREHLVPLSEAIVALARGRTGYFLMHCAMQGCPEPCENCPMERYSPWIQTSREVENPYMGLKHIKCGIVSLDQSAR
jgi:hypothetical protein